GNRAQAREGAAIVVLVVALDQPWRDAQKSPGPAKERCDLVFHVDVSRIRRGRLDVVMPHAAALAAARSPLRAFDRIRETTCAKPQPAGGRCAVLGRMPWERATAIGPYSFQMSRRDSKVNGPSQRARSRGPFIRSPQGIPSIHRMLKLFPPPCRAP